MGIELAIHHPERNELGLSPWQSGRVCTAAKHKNGHA
jgi:hypothetical protein